MMRIAYALLWVHDQDEAVAFYTEKLGWEVRADVTVAELGNFRWLTVGPAGQPDVAVVLTSDDVQAAYEDLSARGVEFVEPPEGRPYGIDSAFRDPSGNFLRLMQLREPPAA